MGDALRTPLEALLARIIPGFVALVDAVQLTTGASQETWRVRYGTGRGEASLALRRAQPTAVAPPDGQVALPTEARLLTLAGHGGVPVPQVLHVLQDDDGLGAGFLMAWLEGETLGQRIVRAEHLAQVRPRLARQCGEILGRIHTLDWRAAGLDAELATTDPAALIDDTWARYRDLDVPVPMIDYVWRWLHENLPRESRRALVHGDFRNGNLMVGPQGIVAVLDWELAHLGDPLRDLGWLCVNSWRFGNAALPVGGFGETDELLAGYRATSGIEVTAAQLRFWQVFGSFWWAVTTLHMAATWRSGETPSLERPVIGRRSSEAQMDCVNLLIPGGFTLPAAGPDLAAGTQLPMPAELLEGVVSFLREDVTARLDSHAGFLARVAANSLRIAQRELLHGEPLRSQELQRLEQLLGHSGSIDTLRRELVARLRMDLPLDTPGLAAHLRQTVAGQLYIDQPHYSALAIPPD